MGPSLKCAIILVLATLSDITLASCPKQKLLEDILSPANAERALQILKLATLGANRLNPTGTLLDDIGLPVYLPSVAPVKPVLPLRPSLPPLPRPVVSQPLPVVSQPLPEICAPVAPVIQEKVCPGVPIPQPCASALPVSYPAPPVSYPAQPVVYPAPPAPCSVAPVPLVNPFLPAASPVSALAPPTSNLLPPVVPTQVRSNFLRKIPIPPPSL